MKKGGKLVVTELKRKEKEKSFSMAKCVGGSQLHMSFFVLYTKTVCIATTHTCCHVSGRPRLFVLCVCGGGEGGDDNSPPKKEVLTSRVPKCLKTIIWNKVFSYLPWGGGGGTCLFSPPPPIHPGMYQPQQLNFIQSVVDTQINMLFISKHSELFQYSDNQYVVKYAHDKMHMP